MSRARHTPFRCIDGRRFAVQEKREEQEEWMNPQPVQSSEIPKASSCSGWMRNERDVRELFGWSAVPTYEELTTKQCNMILLHELPTDHPLRNTPLADIRAECRNIHSQTWRPVMTWVIGRVTYNQLRGPWLDLSEFRVPPPQ